MFLMIVYCISWISDILYSQSALNVIIKKYIFMVMTKDELPSHWLTWSLSFGVKWGMLVDAEYNYCYGLLQHPVLQLVSFCCWISLQRHLNHDHKNKTTSVSWIRSWECNSWELYYLEQEGNICSEAKDNKTYNALLRISLINLFTFQL